VRVTIRTGASTTETATGRADPRLLGLGGWSPTHLHVLDVAARVLHLGDGSSLARVRPAEAVCDGRDALRLVGSTGVLWFDLDGRHLRSDTTTGAVLWRVERGQDGRVVAWSDRAGRRTTLEAVAPADAGSVATLRLVAGSAVSTVTLDADGWLASVTSPAGRRVAAEHDAGGGLRRLVHADGGETRFDLDDDGVVETVTRPGEGPRRRVEQDRDGRRRVVVLSGEGREFTSDVEQVDGSSVRATRCCGRGSATRVAVRGAVTTTTHPDGTRVERRDDTGAAARTTSRTVVLPSGLAVTSRVSVERLDDGRLVHRHGVGDSAHATVESPDGRLVEAWSPEGRRSRVERDELGRPVLLAAAGHPTQLVEYDADGPTRITVGELTLEHLADQDGDTAAMRFAGDDQQTWFEHDDDGLLVAQHLPGDRSVRLAHDATGQITSLTPPGRDAHAFTWAAPGRLATSTTPAVDGVRATTTRHHDADGLLVRIEGPGERRVHLDRDAGGRLVGVRTERDGQSVGHVRHRHDPETGRLLEVANDTASIHHEWDGALLRAVATSGPAPGRLVRDHGPDLAVVRETVVTGEDSDTVEFVHDRDGLVVRAGALELVRDPASGHVVARRLGVVSEELTRREDGRVTRVAVSVDGRPLAEALHTWDEHARLVSREVVMDGRRRRHEYTYDHAGRLATVTVDGEVVADHVWDANGARLALHADDPGTVTVDARDRPVRRGDTTYTNALDGPRTAATSANGSTTGYHHDLAGRLLGVTTPDHAVVHQLDPHGRRITTQVDDETTLRLLWGAQRHPVAELDEGGGLRTRFVHGEDRLAPSHLRRDGREFLVVTDHVGSPWLVVDAVSGAVVQHLVHDAWGRVVHDTNPGFQPFGFTGGILEPTTGLVHLGARDLDVLTGTWTAPDPIGFASATTNLVAYAHGDPVNHHDPTGTKVERCRALSGIPAQADLGIEHHWARTGEREAGIGSHPEPPADSVWPGAETSMVDHTGRGDKRGSTCEEVEDVDEDCVNRMLDTPNVASDGTRYGGDEGLYMPWNQCQSKIHNILAACSTRTGVDRSYKDGLGPYSIDRSSGVHGGRQSDAPPPKDHTPDPGYTPVEGYDAGDGGEAWE